LSRENEYFSFCNRVFALALHLPAAHARQKAIQNGTAPQKILDKLINSAIFKLDDYHSSQVSANSIIVFIIFNYFYGGCSMKLKPLADRVVVKPFEAEEKTHGSIIIPDTAKEKPQKGKIVAVGPGKRAENGTVIPMEVKEGNIVLYGKYSGTEVTIDGEDYLIMRESDVLAII